MSIVNLTIHLKTVEDKIRSLNKGRLRRLTPTEMLTLIEGQALILDELTNTWPVRTGLSKAGWQVQLKTRGELGYFVFNDVYYSSWVFRKDEGPDPLWPQLIRAAQAIIDDQISPKLLTEVELTQPDTDRADVRDSTERLRLTKNLTATRLPTVETPGRSRSRGSGLISLASIAPLLRRKKKRTRRAGR